MTEHQREDEFLAELLDMPEAANPIDVIPTQQQLSRREERALLDLANQAGTPTLAPQEFELGAASGGESFLGEATRFVRRYPVPSLLAGFAVAFLLARRRR